MLTFLHTADWQIGRQYARFLPEDAALLFEARFQAITKIAQLAVEKRVDFVVVAGDIFDSQTLSDRQVLRCFEALKAYPGPWLLLPGNHDAALSESVWTRAQRLQAVPEQVHLLLSPDPFSLTELNAVVLPGVLRQRQSYQDLSAWFDEVPVQAGVYRVGLAHGSVQGVLAEHIDSHNPIAADRAQRAQLDYLALGDWHGLRQINERTWYSGTPEPDRFKDNQPGHVVLVSLSEPGAVPVVEAIPTARYHWHSIRYEFTHDEQVQDLAQSLQAYDLHSVLELSLSGHLSLAATQTLDDMLLKAQARVRSLEIRREDLHLSASEDDICELNADGYVHEALLALQAKQAQEGPQSLVAGDALLLMAQILKQLRQDK